MPKEYRTIQEISGPLMMVTGVEDVTYDELGEIELENGERKCEALLSFFYLIAPIYIEEFYVFKQVIGSFPYYIKYFCNTVDETLPPVVVPKNNAEAKTLTENNPLYSTSLESPVRCDLELLPGGK